LHYPRDGIIVGGLVTAQLFRRLLEPFLVERFKIEGKGSFKHLLEKIDEPVGAIFRFGHVAQSFFDFPRRADADFIPIEKALAKVSERPVSLRAGSPLAANGVQELFKNRP